MDGYRLNLLMQNPQESSGKWNDGVISPGDMHRYDTHRNAPWGLEGYVTPRRSFDARKVIQERAWAVQKKGVRLSEAYVTRRGFFMDYHIKTMRGVPSPAAYQQQQPWDGTHHDLETEALAAVRKATKSTYIESIEKELAKRPVPGVGAYQLDGKPDTKERKAGVGEKRWYLEDVEMLSAGVPGMGEYNPREMVRQTRRRKDDNWQSMKKRHDKVSQSEYMRSHKLPAAGTYTPILMDSFDGKKSRLKQIKHGFGSDARFPYVRKNMKAIREVRPAPCAYQTTILQKDKSVSPKTKQWIKMIWKGSPAKVYS